MITPYASKTIKCPKKLGKQTIGTSCYFKCVEGDSGALGKEVELARERGETAIEEQWEADEKVR